MIIFSVLILLPGMFALYHTSKRARIGSSSLAKWLHTRPRIAKVIALSSTIASFALLINALGFAAGIFYAFTSLMMIISLLVLIIPLIKFLRKSEKADISIND